MFSIASFNASTVVTVYIFASGSVFLTNPVSVFPAHIFFNVSSNLTLEEA